jgi:hypothetical protein
MTAERSRAYALVLRLLGEVGPARLRPAEAAAVREAADALLFCSDIGADVEARAALERLDEIVELVVEAGRLRVATGETLLDAVEACGPRPVWAPL